MIRTHVGGVEQPMPWMQYWTGMQVAGDPHQRACALGIPNMRIWRMYHWSPRAAEMVLHYIARGHWNMEAST